jgi:hypothetical protein
VAEAPHAAEHRHRRIGGRASAGHWLGCGDGVARASSIAAGGDYLPLDAAAFLGAFALPYEDYARARVPMLPVVSGKSETRKQIVIYTVLVVASGFAPVFFGFAGPVYLSANSVIGLWFLAQAVRVARETDTQREPQARRLFGVSILYLFALFAALLVEQAVGLSSFPALGLG